MLISLTSASLFAQLSKKVLTHADYDHWRSLSGWNISADGLFIHYIESLPENDDTLYLKNIKGELLHVVPRGSEASFTYDSRYFLYKVKPGYSDIRKAKKAKKKPDEMPKDTLEIMNIYSDHIHRIGNVDNYKVPQKWSGWLAYELANLPEKTKKDTTSEKSDNPSADAIAEEDADKKKPKGKKVVLRKFSDGSEYAFEHVTEYRFAEEGRMFYFITEGGDSTTHAAVYEFDLTSTQQMLIDSSQVVYKHLAVDRPGQQLAFLATADSIKAEMPVYNLFYWSAVTNKLNIIIKDNTNKATKDWQMSPAKAPLFSYDGTRIFSGIAPKKLKLEYESDTTLLDEERVKVDIWSWHDKVIQPQQLKELDSEKDRSYLSCFDIGKNSFIWLADKSVPEVKSNKHWKADHVIGMSESPYQLSNSWEIPGYSDIYLINLQKNERKLILKKTKGNPMLSPAGRFVYWYEPADSCWHTYNIANSKQTNVTKNIGVSFYDETNDLPSDPQSYGHAVWTENDQHLIIYDKYDLWMVDPTGVKKAYCLTEGYGRNHNIKFNYVHLEEERDFVKQGEAILLSAFHLFNKKQGYYRDSIKTDNKPIELVFDDVGYNEIRKAKNANQLIFRSGNFRNFYDLFTSTLNFNNITRISDVNPQTSDYVWGRQKLISWNSFDGDTLQGILYTPDNLDSTVSYPMIVYFYEKWSQNLHFHMSPSPSRSTVNIPYYLSNGYIVFVPDINYQEGLPGQSAYNSIVPGVMKVLTYGIVDEKNIGIQGQSWGGYQVAYLVTRTSMFKAAMAGAPVSNMTSAYGGIRWQTGRSRMFQYERTQSRIGGTLWEKPMLFLENSPIFYVDRIQTPLLIMHNDADGAVPWYQGIEFFMALRRLQKPAWMLVYNGEAHNLTKRPNMKDLSIRMAQFFDHYLKGAPEPVWMRDGIPAVEKGRTLRYDRVE